MMLKLAFKNIRRSFSDFWIYFLTVAMGVSIFYIFNSIKNVDQVLTLMNWQRFSLKNVGDAISVISFFIAGVMAFLMVYANNFLLKRRAKELGTYLLLGMENRRVAQMIFFETLLIGLCACVAGLIFGVFISQAMVLLIIRFFNIQNAMFHFFISQNGIFFSIGAFVVMFILILIWNVIRSYRFRIISLMRLREKNEKLVNVGKVWEVLLFFIGLGILSYGYYLIHRSGFMVLFGTDFSMSILFGTIGTILVFRGLAAAFLRMIKHFSGYYKNLNLFFIRQIAKNIRGAYFSMAIISILILFGMGSLIAGAAISNEWNHYKKSLSSFDLSIEAALTENENNRKEFSLDKLLQSQGIDLKKETKEYMELRKYIDSAQTNMDVFPFLQEPLTKFGESRLTRLGHMSVVMIPYSDYVSAQKLKGENILPLKKGEVLILNEVEGATKQLQEKTGQMLHLSGKEYRLAAVGPIGMQNSSEEEVLYFILQDEELAHRKVNRRVLNINYLRPEDDERFACSPRFYESENLKTQESLREKLEKIDDGKNFNFVFSISRQEILQDQKGMQFMMMVITAFIGLIFIFFTAALLAMQQLSMQEADLKAYGVLQTLGASEKQIRGVLFKQISFYFLIPLVVGIIHTFFGIHAFLEMMMGVMGSGLFSSLRAALVMGGTVCVIYTLYFIVTYTMLRRGIEKMQ